VKESNIEGGGTGEERCPSLSLYSVLAADGASLTFAFSAETGPPGLVPEQLKEPNLPPSLDCARIFRQQYVLASLTSDPSEAFRPYLTTDSWALLLLDAPVYQSE